MLSSLSHSAGDDFPNSAHDHRGAPKFRTDRSALVHVWEAEDAQQPWAQVAWTEGAQGSVLLPRLAEPA